MNLRHDPLPTTKIVCSETLHHMNPNLDKLIAAYQSRVLRAAALLRQSGIPMPETTMQWVTNGISRRGQLEGGIDYLKHGYGCTVNLADGVIDFDFGPNGELDGFDAGRLTEFAGYDLPQYGFADAAALQLGLKAAQTAGSLLTLGPLLRTASAPAARLDGLAAASTESKAQ